MGECAIGRASGFAYIKVRFTEIIMNVVYADFGAAGIARNSLSANLESPLGRTHTCTVRATLAGVER